MKPGVDVWRSLLRQGFERVWVGVGQMRQRSSPRRWLQRLTSGQRHISEAELSTAVAHLPGVRDASATIIDGSIIVDLSGNDGSAASFALTPRACHFAPRGAKELSFAVHPPPLADDRRTRAVVAVVAAKVAERLWMLVVDDVVADVVVEREGADGLRIDLATLPAARQLRRQRGGELLLEGIELQTLQARRGVLVVQLRLPGWTSPPAS